MISEKQEEKVKSCAKNDGISFSEMLRKIIDAFFKRNTGGEK